MLSSIFLTQTPKWPFQKLFHTYPSSSSPRTPNPFSFHLLLLLRYFFVAVVPPPDLAASAPAPPVISLFLLCSYTEELKWLHVHVSCGLVYNGCERETFNPLQCKADCLQKSVLGPMFLFLWNKGKNPQKVRRHFKLRLCSDSLLFRFSISAKFPICKRKSEGSKGLWISAKGKGLLSWDELLELPTLHRYI